ncbi:ATP-binding cassette domain-containing protein [Litoribacter alkaliphilus]|uniref:ATP-binding cassette domain-containing protein n=1 Tax=Litoribacter ruber TaxID=702568 RepID=A0AAP2CFC2_9BACT|nr:ATP-binding cassette domain-containing protein [Litoribacter alkaliphilus]MBS9522404.1 ATP-binding cassette domain-containing protein [Litoribacter alkaliphilus]
MKDEKNPEMFPAKINNYSIRFKDVDFRYVGSQENVIKNLNMEIPAGKVSAIVGSSGSGKSTILKLILKYYEISSGACLITDGENEYNLNEISTSSWRDHCGVVSQSGYIFNDSILSNIILCKDSFNERQFKLATHISNLDEFVSKLPMGYLSPIGNEGLALSGGQILRILIARAIYKNPSILIFDEATSSLDTINESIIVSRLREFYLKRTVIIIAHRLSTVKNSDNIFVLDNGKIVEYGNHEKLLTYNRYYQELVNRQLNA